MGWTPQTPLGTALTHYLINGKIFGGGSNIFNIICVFLSSQQTSVWYRSADKSLARPGRKQANVSVRMAWISFGALPCRKKKTLWQLASRCCWNVARPWHTYELVYFLVGLRTYQHPGTFLVLRKTLHDVAINVRWSSRYSCQILIKLLISRHIFEKFTSPWKSGQWEPSCCTRSDWLVHWRTGMTKVTMAFPNFSNALVTHKMSQYSN